MSTRESSAHALNRAEDGAPEPAGFTPLDLNGHKWKKALLDALVDGAFLIDDQDIVLDVNRAAETIFGYNTELMVGRDIDDFVIGGDGEPLKSQVLNGDTSKPEYHEANRSFRGSIARKDGRQSSCEVSVSPISMPESQQRWLVTVRETELRDFEQARERESFKMSAAMDLAARIANDFNNQLAAISGNIETATLQLQEDAAGPPPALLGARDAVNQAARIVRRLEGFARPTTSMLQPMDPSALIDRALRFLKSELPPKVNLNVELNHGDWTVNADPDQIGDTLLNMGTNARDAMPAGGELTFSTKQARMPVLGGNNGKERDYVQIDVTDTGCGISREILPRIFDAFFTTHKSVQGAGLGLSGVYGVLKQHEGGVTVESKLGVGTTFHIFLPRATNNSPAAVPEPKLKLLRGTETVLVIDDESSVRAATRRTLEHCGYRVLEAPDGIEGLGVYSEDHERIDLVLLDVMMPEMSGWDVLAKLKSLDPQLPVVMVSGYAWAGQAPKHMNVSADGFIRKPFELAELTNEVRRLLDKT